MLRNVSSTSTSLVRSLKRNLIRYVRRRFKNGAIIQINLLLCRVSVFFTLNVPFRFNTRFESV